MRIFIWFGRPLSGRTTRINQIKKDLFDFEKRVKVISANVLLQERFRQIQNRISFYGPEFSFSEKELLDTSPVSLEKAAEKLLWLQVMYEKGFITNVLHYQHLRYLVYLHVDFLEEVNEVIKPALDAANKLNIILQGFPRNMVQAEFLLNYMEKNGHQPIIIEMMASHEEVLKRMYSKLLCENCRTPYSREGDEAPRVEGICDNCGGVLGSCTSDTLGALEHRNGLYSDNTLPVIAYFRKRGIPYITQENKWPTKHVTGLFI